MSSLIPCPACNRQVSVAAHACPNCGHPIAQAAQPRQDGRTDVGRTIGKVATVAGAAYAVPWIARLIVAVVALLVFAFFIFR